MLGDDYTPEEIDERLGFCVALLRAGQTGDMDGMERLIESEPELRPVVSMLSGIANAIGYVAHGRERFAALTASWQPGHGIPGIHSIPASTRTNRIARTVAALGIISAVIHSDRAGEDHHEQLATAAAELIPDLYTEGAVAPAIAFARITEAAITTAALAKGQSIEQTWQELAASITEQIHRSE